MTSELAKAIMEVNQSLGKINRTLVQMKDALNVIQRSVDAFKKP